MAAVAPQSEDVRVPSARPTPAPAVPEAEARRLRALFHHVPALIAFWDKDLRNVIANEAYVDWFGVAPERMKGMHIREVLGERVFAMNLPYIEGALAGEEQLFSRTLVDMHGVVHHTQASYVPEIVAGEVRGFFVLVTDVTPWVEARRQMDEAQQIAELGSWSVDPRTRDIVWSAQMYRITGLDPGSVRPSFDLLVPMVHPEDRERVLDRATRSMESGEDYELDYRLVRPDGEVREVHSRVHGELSTDGEVLRLTGTMQDVTSSRTLNRELTRVNENLREVNRLNADVLGVVGHDLRSPLSVLVGHLEDLTETWDVTAEEDKLARVGLASRAARRLTTMVDDILAMARLDSGSIATRATQVEVVEVVRNALSAVEHGARVEVEADAEPTVVTDPVHLRHVVTNLVANALRYGEPPFIVRVNERDGWVQVHVIDHGEGVPEGFVPHLFERFTRATSGVATRRPGSGFGLYIVGRLAQANGYVVGYEPGMPSGSHFILELPGGDRDDGADRPA